MAIELFVNGTLMRGLGFKQICQRHQRWF